MKTTQPAVYSFPLPLDAMDALRQARAELAAVADRCACGREGCEGRCGAVAVPIEWRT